MNFYIFCKNLIKNHVFSSIFIKLLIFNENIKKVAKFRLVC